MDPDAYDQFLIGIGTGVALQVFQNALPEPVVLQERPVSTLNEVLDYVRRVNRHPSQNV